MMRRLWFDAYNAVEGFSYLLPRRHYSMAKLAQRLVDQLKTYAEANGYTQSDIARFLNLDRRRIAPYWHGKCLPGLETAMKIRRLLRKAKRGEVDLAETQDVNPLLRQLNAKPRQPKKNSPFVASSSLEPEPLVNPMMTAQLAKWKPQRAEVADKLANLPNGVRSDEASGVTIVTGAPISRSKAAEPLPKAVPAVRIATMDKTAVSPDPIEPDDDAADPLADFGFEEWPDDKF